jgi:urease subunit gamma/beta
MYLTPTELERLTIFTAAQLAIQRRSRGLKLNYPEAVSIIVNNILEGAREGRSVADLMSYGSTILSTDDVMPGIAEMMGIIQVEGVFPDGTKLVTVHDPIRPGKELVSEDKQIVPGEIITQDGDLELNAYRKTITLRAVNTGDRPIQIGSHYHFFEANKALEFDREKSFGMRLDIPAGTAVRFEPGQAKECLLCAFGGKQEIYGLNNLTNGSVNSDDIRTAALKRAKEAGFKGA